jgi:glutaredoxin
MPIKVYTRTTCAPCRLVKTWLQKNGFAYTEINVDEDPAAAGEIVRLSGVLQVPMTVIGEQIVSGMNIGRLASILKSA